jgi:hypothetical protein
MAEHKDLTGDKLHTPFRWVFVDEAERLAESVTADDVNKIALQLSNYTLWYLESHSPAQWEVLGSIPVITTQGDLIIGDSEGSPIRFAAGTNGQLLYYYNGTLVKMAAGAEGQAPLFTADGHLAPGDVYGEWMVVDTVDISSPMANISFEGLDGSSFDYKIEIEGLYGTGTGDAYLDLGYGGTPTYVTSGWAMDGEAFASDNPLMLFIVSGVAYNSAFGTIKVLSHANTNPCVFYHISATGGGGINVDYSGPTTARWTQLDTITAIRLRHSTNTFVGGRVVLKSRAK